MSPLFRLLVIVLALALPTLLPGTVSAGNYAQYKPSQSADNPPAMLGGLFSSLMTPKKELKVYRITYQEAMDIAYRVAGDAFRKAHLRISDDQTWVGINKYPRQNTASAVIRPRIVENLNDPEVYGILFEAEAYEDYSISKVKRKFQKQMGKYLQQNPLETALFTDYRITEDAGWAELAPDTIPYSYTGFQGYVDHRKDLREYEGIWEVEGGRYTLGIYYRPKDPQYKYHAVVIKTRNPQWRPGQIKAKFSRLSKNKPTPGVYLDGTKAELGIVVKPDAESIIATHQDSKITLLKVYPIHDEAVDRFDGMGTGWAVDNKGTFVTNAHVIQDASKIFVGHRDADPIRARVMIVDEQNDLAVLRLKKKGPNVTPLPLSGQGKIPNGTNVVAIGFPQAFILGDSPRITEGVIAAQNGYQKDITRYQMTATIDSGNSGGPVVDDHGNVAGVSVETVQPGRVSHSFAVKVNYVRSLLEQVEVDFTIGDNDETLSPQQIFERYEGAVLPIWTE